MEAIKNKIMNMDEIQLKKKGRAIQSILLGLLKLIILVGIAYIILGPVITMISHAFFTEDDLYNPVVVLFPEEGTLNNFITAFTRMTFTKTFASTMIYVITLTLMQLFICSLAGYGLVILTIVIPADALMLPWYTQFRNFDVFGILHLIKGSGINLIGTKAPMYIMTLFGCGFRSGLYIYIFNQFFRGVPKEIEEAASIDGAGPFYTYFRIMLINTMPAILTVSIFSLVWQYNDVFYAKIFAIKNSALMSLRISSLQATIQEIEKIKDPAVAQLYLYAGIIMMIIPIIIIYVLLQKRFTEGVERSGIVG